MGFEIISRREWQAKPAESFTLWNPADLLGATIHHFSSPRAPDNASGSAPLMRSVQNSHMAGEYNDIAYNFCFDDFGQIFEGRGWNRQTGANGTTASNLTYISFCYIGNTDRDAFSELAQDACGWLLAEAFKKGVGVRVVGHRNWVSTGCPGDKGEAWVASGGWRKDLPTAKKVQYLLVDEGVILDRSAVVPLSESKDRLDKFLNSDAQAEMHKHLAAEGELGVVQVHRKVILE